MKVDKSTRLQCVTKSVRHDVFVDAAKLSCSFVFLLFFALFQSSYFCLFVRMRRLRLFISYNMHACMHICFWFFMSLFDICVIINMWVIQYITVDLHSIYCSYAGYINGKQAHSGIFTATLVVSAAHNMTW